MAQLPTMTIPDADLPRLRAALRAKMNDLSGSMTDSALYKAWVAQTLAQEVRAYETIQAVLNAQTGLTAPPVLT